MMIAIKGYAAQNDTEELEPWNFERREIGHHDVQIEILHYGVCHTEKGNTFAFGYWYNQWKRTEQGWCITAIKLK